MAGKRIGTQTVLLTREPAILSSGCVTGKKEGEGPLRESFDRVEEDPYWGRETFEKAEAAMAREALKLAMEKAQISPEKADMVFAGDLQNQCAGTGFGLRESGIPHLGVYGACSTMAESLLLAAMAVDGGYAHTAAAVTSSHFCTAERQFRMPLEYGGQRTPTAQWTATAAGAAILRDISGLYPRVTAVTPGKIVDGGITDACNMGAAMAPAAFETIRAHLGGMRTSPGDYDLILTGDLGYFGGDILTDLFRRDGVNIEPVYNDCGMMLYDPSAQDVHAGGSGCGCSAAVFCGHILGGMRSGRWRRILFIATGALLSTVSCQQGESIPAVAHCVEIEYRED